MGRMETKVIIKELVDLDYIRRQTDKNSDTDGIDIDYLVYAYHTVMKAILTEVWENRDNPEYITGEPVISAIWEGNDITKGKLSKNIHVVKELGNEFNEIRDLRDVIERVLMSKQEVAVTGLHPINKCVTLKYNSFKRGALSDEGIMKEIVNDNKFLVNNVHIYDALMFRDTYIHVELTVTEKDVNLRGLFAKRLFKSIFKSLLGL